MRKAIYICYFGLREPLVQTQVLPYIREIAKADVEFELLTFEPSGQDELEFEKYRAELSAEGIQWHWRRYHKRFSVFATAYDVLRGIVVTWRRIGKGDIDIVHCRVHVPQLMALVARKFSRHKPTILFDIRGFFPEEYTDAGIWPKGGWLYRGAKRIEAWLLRESDAFVVLTEKARDIMFPESRLTGRDKLGRPIEVIPCCVDFDNRFAGEPLAKRQEFRQRLNIEGRWVILHLGALGGLYLTDQIADLLAAARQADPSVFAMFLTQSEPEKIIPLLRARGFSEADYFVKKVPAADIQGYLEASDIGLSIVMATFATASRSPTKIPEYLAGGLPIIANRGVGDVDDLIVTNNVGVLLDDFSEASYRKALDEIANLGDTSVRCRATARREFDLKGVGGERYRRLYRRLR